MKNRDMLILIAISCPRCGLSVAWPKPRSDAFHNCVRKQLTSEATMIFQKIAVGLAACMLMGAIPTLATSHADVGASGHGQWDDLNPPDTLSLTACVTQVDDFNSQMNAEPCQAFVPASFTVDGHTVAGGYYAYVDGSGLAAGVYDVFQLPVTVGVGTQVISASTVNALGAFLCSDKKSGQSQALDSSSTPLPNPVDPSVPCTPDVTSALNSILAQPNANTLQFISVPTSTWVFYTDYTPNSTTISGVSFGTAGVPEPGTLGLLCSGVLALCGMARRRRRDGR